MIERTPNVIPASSVNNEISGIIDMLPTVCAIAGVDVPSDRVIDGRSILPYMQNKRLPQPINDTFVVPGSTIRYKDFKLHIKDQKVGGSNKGKGRTDRAPAQGGSLFNLRKDPGETTDVSKQHPEIFSDLKRRMSAVMAELKANTRQIGKIADDDIV